MLNNIIIIVIFIVFTPSILKLIRAIILLSESIKESDRCYTLLESLKKLTFKEFRLWCIDYLLSIGYEDIMFTTESEADLICKKADSIYLVKCLRPSKSLSLAEIQLHIGTMISENIHNGIIITTSEVSIKNYDYIEEICDRYNIEIISKNNFEEEYDELNFIEFN